MCNKITKISEQNKHQWLGTCAHGIAHLHWRALQVGMSLRSLENLVLKAQSSSLPVERRGEHYVLWLGNAAIKLDHEAYLELTELFSEAKLPQSKPQYHSQIQISRCPKPDTVLH